MIRLCGIFVLLAVVVPLSDAQPQKWEQRERSITDLGLAEDAMNKVKRLLANCEESNSSGCSKKDKSLGFIDAALDLVSEAKKNIPICPHDPTEEPTPEVTTTPEFTTEDSTPEVTTEERRPMDCQDLQAAGVVTSGVYTVGLRGESVEVRCDMDTDGGGWTVIQRRGKFSWEVNFDLEWNDYKTGFGILHEEFWWGNDNIFALTNQGGYSLRLDMTAADGDRAYASYRIFRIEDENANYTLHVGGYSGTAGDNLNYSNGKQFSTRDIKNNKMSVQNCAVERKGGFWYDDCSHCNPNGLYRPGVDDVTSMAYWDFKKNVGLSSFEMKIKRL